ncbi:hypothetical protein BGZ54_001098 [Gamsiella multidivaricata]|nr:hypothetical protein BGZ54_001098 [Gamsiella multidivaricata]
MKTQAAYYLASSSLSIIPSVRPIVSKTPAAAIPHRASNPASTAGPSSSNDNEVDGKGLWNKNGMNTLVNWITDADSYDSYFGKRLADVTLSHLQEEIAQHINQQNISKGKLGTLSWTKGMVKSRMEYLKKKYDIASTELKKTGAGNTEEGTLMDLVRDICPCYEKLNAVFHGTLARDPPKPHRSLVSPPNNGPISTISRISTAPVSPAPSATLRVIDHIDSEDDMADDISEHNLTESQQATTSSDMSEQGERDKGSANKCRKPNKLKTAEELYNNFDNLIDAAIELSRAQVKKMNHSSQDFNRRAELAAQREAAMIQKERLLEESMTQRQKALEEKLSAIEKRHNEMLGERAQSLERMMQRRLEELIEEKADFKQEKADFKQEKAEFKQEVAQFRARRDELLCENAAMKRELKLTTAKAAIL